MTRAVAAAIGATAALLAGSPLPCTAAVTLSAARIWPAPEYTRITFEAPAPIKHRVATLPTPPRLIVDLDEVDGSAIIDGLASRISPDDPYVRAIRAGRFRPGTIRLVFDLKVEVRPQSFLLRPVGDYGYRLVLDLYPAQPQDPILSLLLETARTGGGAAAAPAAPTDGTNALPAPSPPPLAATSEPGPGARISANTQARLSSSRTAVIAIDAGHGGEDPGARGRLGTQEKEVTLSIARRLKELVDATDGMRAFMVRDGDYFVPLHKRVARARAAQADVFVSIHADAFIKPHARGSSVFALSERGATSAAARWLAKRENDADLIGGVNIDVPDPMLKQVLLDLSQTATINDGLKLGRAVLQELGQINSLHKPAVEQAGFAVLKAPDIPSILVETAFISNPDEEEKLRDEDYQQRMAASLLAGLQRYLARHPPRAPGIEATSELPRAPLGDGSSPSQPALRQAGGPIRATAPETAGGNRIASAHRSGLLRVALDLSGPAVTPQSAGAPAAATARPRTNLRTPSQNREPVKSSARVKAAATPAHASKPPERASARDPSSCEARLKGNGRCTPRKPAQQRNMARG